MNQIHPAMCGDLSLMDGAAFPAHSRASPIDRLLRQALTRIGGPDQE